MRNDKRTGERSGERDLQAVSPLQCKQGVYVCVCVCSAKDVYEAVYTLGRNSHATWQQTCRVYPLYMHLFWSLLLPSKHHAWTRGRADVWRRDGEAERSH